MGADAAPGEALALRLRQEKEKFRGRSRSPGSTPREGQGSGFGFSAGLLRTRLPSAPRNAPEVAPHPSKLKRAESLGNPCAPSANTGRAPSRGLSEDRPTHEPAGWPTPKQATSCQVYLEVLGPASAGPQADGNSSPAVSRTREESPSPWPGESALAAGGGDLQNADLRDRRHSVLRRRRDLSPTGIPSRGCPPCHFLGDDRRPSRSLVRLSYHPLSGV